MENLPHHKPSCLHFYPCWGCTRGLVHDLLQGYGLSGGTGFTALAVKVSLQRSQVHCLSAFFPITPHNQLLQELHSKWWWCLETRVCLGVDLLAVGTGKRVCVDPTHKMLAWKFDRLIQDVAAALAGDILSTQATMFCPGLKDKRCSVDTTILSCFQCALHGQVTRVTKPWGVDRGVELNVTLKKLL